jgi:uncharacterized protein (DUF2336 family)
LLLDIEQAMSSRDAKQRSTVLERVTELFFQAAPGGSQAELFDEVFLHLVRQVETSARARLSQRLASTEIAPTGVIETLARDDEIEVAAPILAGSARLSESILVEVAKTKSQAHLLSIAGRSSVGEAVSDVLVERGDSQVLQRLSGNAAARFSPEGFVGLARRGAEDEAVALNIANRADVPAAAFRQLLAQATDAVRESLLSQSSPDHHRIIMQAMEEVCDEVARVRGPEITADARRVVYEMFEQRKLNETAILEFARSDMYAEVAVSLSTLTSAPIEMVEHQMRSGRMSGLLLLCRSKDFKWTTAKAVLAIAAERSEADFELARHEYLTLSVATAARAMRFVGAKQTLLNGSPDSAGGGLMKTQMKPLLA